MKTFSNFDTDISEQTSLALSVGTISTILSKLKIIEGKVRSSENHSEQNALLSEQNKLLGYLTAFQIALASSDRKLLQKLNSMIKTKSK